MTGDKDWDGQHVKQDVLVAQRHRCGGRQREDLDQRLDEEDQGEDRDGEDDVGVAPVLAHLLADDCSDAPRVRPHRGSA